MRTTADGKMPLYGGDGLVQRTPTNVGEWLTGGVGGRPRRSVHADRGAIVIAEPPGGPPGGSLLRDGAGWVGASQTA